MAAPVWKFVVTDLMFNQIGELHDYFDMTINRRLNGTDSGSFRVRSEHPMFDVLFSQKCMIKGYRDGILQAYMYVWSAEITGEADKMSLAVTLASPAARMASVYPLAGAGGKTIPLQTRSEVTDRYYIFRVAATLGILRHCSYTPGTAALAFSGDTAIGVRPYLPLYVPSAYEGPYDTMTNIYYDRTDDTANLQSVSDYLNWAAAGTGGFDWVWNPTEPKTWRAHNTTIVQNPYTYEYLKNVVDPNATNTGYSDSGVLYPEFDPVASLEAANYVTNDNNVGGLEESAFYYQSVADFRGKALIGENKSASAIFDYGTGSFNLTGFKFTSDRQYQANHLTQRYGESNPTLITVGDAADPQHQTWGLMQGSGDFQMNDGTVLAEMLAQAVTLRKQPLRRIEITPVSSYGAASDPPNFGVDYALGDFVSVNIANPLTGAQIVSGLVRVHAITWNLKETGTETASLTIVES